MRHRCARALDELGAVCSRLDDQALMAAVDVIAAAKRIAVYGVGREGLQIRGLAMRLFHLGLDTSVVGDMTAPPIGLGDLLIVSAGPGSFGTVSALIDVAASAGAKTLVVTAQPTGASARRADLLLTIPAQTMADDREETASVLPMGSLFEGAEFVVFEALVLELRDRLGVPPETMRARHTNLE